MIIPDPCLALHHTKAAYESRNLSKVVVATTVALSFISFWRGAARRIGMAWEQLPEPRHPFSLEVIARDVVGFALRRLKRDVDGT